MLKRRIDFRVTELEDDSRHGLGKSGGRGRKETEWCATKKKNKPQIMHPEKVYSSKKTGNIQWESMGTWWLWWQTVWGIPLSLYVLLAYRSEQWIPCWIAIVSVCMLLAVLTTRYETHHIIPLWTVVITTCVILPLWWYLSIYVWNNDLWYAGTVLLGATMVYGVAEKERQTWMK
jgi:hypothetical protein